MTEEAKVCIERESVTLRLEKRLLKVLQGLSEAKGMTLGQMAEETFLHTFCAVPGEEGQACASPHTSSQLETIEKLKKACQLDYDAHDCYAFAEGP